MDDQHNECLADIGRLEDRIAELEGERDDWKIAKAELEAMGPTIKMLRWYLGARSVNSEEAAMASQSVIKEFEAFEETWSPLAKARRDYKMPDREGE